MKRIDKKYAIIYIDYEGETLNDDFTTDEIINDYYNTPGTIKHFLNWNFYLIIPTEKLIGTEFTQEEIEKNETYTRKFVMPTESIDDFFKYYFPDLGPKTGKVTLVKGNDFKDARRKALEKFNENYSHIICSYYREFSLMDTISKLDILRAQLINDPNSNLLFYTHISNEFSLAEKKLKMFVDDKDN